MQEIDPRKKDIEMSPEQLREIKQKDKKAKVHRIEEEKKVEKIQNQSYEEQLKIEKKLVSPKGEESENESDIEDSSNVDRPLPSPIITGKE